MIYPMYSVKDSKSTFLPPTFDINDATAKRNFLHACNNQESVMSSHSVDFSLYCVGDFNDENGVVSSLPVPRFICNAEVF